MRYHILHKLILERRSTVCLKLQKTLEVKERILVRAEWTVFSIVKVLHKPQNDLLYNCTVYFFSCAQATWDG